MDYDGGDERVQQVYELNPQAFQHRCLAFVRKQWQLCQQ
jgi:hypothetical protein